MEPAEIAALKERIRRIRERRPVLVKLLERPDLRDLRVDVSQALEEIDELLQEFEQTFGPQD